MNLWPKILFNAQLQLYTLFPLRTAVGSKPLCIRSNELWDISINGHHSQKQQIIEVLVFAELISVPAKCGQRGSDKTEESLRVVIFLSLSWHDARPEWSPGKHDFIDSRDNLRLLAHSSLHLSSRVPYISLTDTHTVCFLYCGSWHQMTQVKSKYTAVTVVEVRRSY